MRHLAPMRNPGHGCDLPAHEPQQALDRARPEEQPGARRCSSSRATPTCWSTTSGPQAMARLRLAYDDVRPVNPASSTSAPSASISAGLMRASGLRRPDPGRRRLSLALLRTGATAPRYVPATVCDRIVGKHVPTRSSRRCCIASARARVKRRCADVRDHGAVRARRPFGRAHLRAAARRIRLCAGARAASARPYARATASSARSFTTTSTGRASSRLIGKPELFATDARFNSHRNRAEHRGGVCIRRRGDAHAHERGMARPCSAQAISRDADELARRPDRRSAPRRNRILCKRRASERRRDANDGRAQPLERIAAGNAPARRDSASIAPRCCGRSATRKPRSSGWLQTA